MLQCVEQFFFPCCSYTLAFFFCFDFFFFLNEGLAMFKAGSVVMSLTEGNV